MHTVIKRKIWVEKIELILNPIFETEEKTIEYDNLDKNLNYNCKKKCELLRKSNSFMESIEFKAKIEFNPDGDLNLNCRLNLNNSIEHNESIEISKISKKVKMSKSRDVTPEMKLKLAKEYSKKVKTINDQF